MEQNSSPKFQKSTSKAHAKMINHLQQAIFLKKFPFCSVPQKPYSAQTLICKAHDSNTLLTSKLWPQPPKVLLKRRHRHTLHTCKATSQKKKKTKTTTTTTTKFRTENKKKIGERF
jgi:hypothetical protein